MMNLRWVSRHMRKKIYFLSGYYLVSFHSNLNVQKVYSNYNTIMMLYDFVILVECQFINFPEIRNRCDSIVKNI